MLILKRLEMEDFGPFKDRQVLDFPDDAGVIVVYGENMRGKSFLLNALRYAFLGTILGRGARKRKLHVIGNRDKADEGLFGFHVDLTFAWDGATYQLVRSCRPREDVTEPDSDADYVQDVLLRKDGHGVLGPDERDRLLAQVLPKEVSRFFLFDGELLQEYEELLIDESETGPRITEAIERILGVPVLKRGRAHVRQLLEEAEKRQAKVAQRHKDTLQLGTKLQTLTEQRAGHMQEQKRLEDDLAELKREKADLDDYLGSVRRYSDLIEERDKAEARKSTLEQELVSAREKLKDTMDEAWRTLLADPVKQAKRTAQIRAEEAMSREMARLRSQALREDECPTCVRPLDAATRERLGGLIDTSGLDTSEISAKRAFAALNDLERVDTTNVAPLVLQIDQRIDEIRIEIGSLKDKLQDLDQQLSDSDPEVLRERKRTYGDVIRKISATERGIVNEKKEIEKKGELVRTLQRQLGSQGGADVKAAQRRTDICRSLLYLFEAGIAAYRDDLRKKVEQTASSLFTSMTTEKEDFDGLTINESYGLTIRHRDGTPVEARSAGAEHVVALALMGALQQNAPLQGPIVMDSPFGRLDAGHTSNVIRTLPDLARQTVLLVYESEVGQTRIRDELGTALRREYKMVRRSARHTVLQKCD